MSTRRSLGYIQNEWVCPNCNTRNKGSVKACENCGAPQPENVHFELGVEQKFVTDENQIKAAQAGADIHCGFCGTRNPATATTCSQCGADLKEGKAREAGRVMQAPPPPPKVIKCQNCGTENPGISTTCSNCGAALPKQPVPQQAIASGSAIPAAKPVANKKTNWFLIGGISAFLAICCIVIGALFLIPTKSAKGTVTNTHWETYVPVEELQPVNHSNERGSPPSDAYNVSCHTEQVCQEKTIDKGNGYSEVVQDCNDEQYCSYTVDEWKTVQTYTLQGNDLNPVYDDPTYSSDQRLGDKSADLSVTFSLDSDTKTYSPKSITEYQQFTIGSTWTLKMNALGGIVSVSP